MSQVIKLGGFIPYVTKGLHQYE